MLLRLPASSLLVNQLSAISSRARGPRRIRPELWVEPPPISFCQILFDRIGWASGAGSAAVAAAVPAQEAVAPHPYPEAKPSRQRQISMLRWL